MCWMLTPDTRTAPPESAVLASSRPPRVTTGATRLWFGKVRNEGGYRSVPHHHGEAETGGYVLSGRARIYFGEKFEDYLDMAEGDWVFVPPFMPHIECNLDRNRPLTWMTTRTPENIVVNLADVPDEDLRDWLTR